MNAVFTALHLPSRLPPIRTSIIAFAVAVLSLSAADRAYGICACCCSGSGTDLPFCGTTNLAPDCTSICTGEGGGSVPVACSATALQTCCSQGDTSDCQS